MTHDESIEVLRHQSDEWVQTMRELLADPKATEKEKRSAMNEILKFIGDQCLTVDAEP